MTKEVRASSAWDTVANELATETLKVASYDNVVLEKAGDLENARMLDYGSGPGVLASVCKDAGADIHTWDINPKIREACAERIGANRVFNSLAEMRGQIFDIITCNLVMCIVSEKEVQAIARRLSRMLRRDGKVFIGFCNPQIYDVPETELDIRFPTGDSYFDHHTIPKIKKEGNYRIFDNVRPISWYHNRFMESRLEQTALHTTAPYKMPGSERTIRDFVIFEQTRS